MADPVYDSDKDLDKLTPEAIRELEEKYDTPADQAEDLAIEDGADPDELERKGMGRKLRKRSEAQDEQEAEALNQRPQDRWQAAKTQHENQVGRGYRKHGNSDKSLLTKIRDQRHKLIIGGSIAAVVIALVFALFGFLNVFKLDDIMSNIDAKTFARLNGVEDRRSVSWMQAYMEMRLMDIGDNPELGKADKSDNLIFRAGKVSTGNPIIDWYRTLRTSKFEQDLLNKDGIRFVSVATTENGKLRVRPGKIFVGNVEVLNYDSLSQKDLDKIASGDTATLNKLNLNQDIIKKFDTDKEARLAIKQAVQDNTHFFQVFKRRQVRKDIQNMTGVRSWRFFENTRNKITEKKIDIRNKIITSAVPEDTLSGKFVRCLFGITDCRFSDDPSDPQYESKAALDGEQNPDKNGDAIDERDSNNQPVKDPETVRLGAAAESFKEITSKILENANVTLKALNIVSTLDSLNRINNALSSGELSKGVAIARGVQAMGLYQVYETARDQLKTGQVTSDEVNQFMQVIGPVASSEGWTKVVNGSGDASTLTSTAASQEYCSSQHQAELEKNIDEADKEFAYLCPDKQIGGGSNAASLESAYKQTIGKVLQPILSAYEGFRHIPIIGGALDLANRIIGSVSSLVSSALSTILSAIGLEDNLQNAMQYIMGKMVAFLGAGPIMNGKEGAGQYMNWLVQGGAFTAEASARANGAALSTPQSQASAQQTLAQYQSDQQAGQSVIDKYFSLSNPNSPVASLALDLSQANYSSIGGLFFNFSKIFKSAGTALFAPLSGHGFAADNGYAGANFAGIQTFDYPSKCLDLNPITAQPLDGTNALQVFQKNGLPVSPDKLSSLDNWDTQSNSILFYQLVYSIIGSRNDADKIAEQIYNCNLLDNTVRGSMGYLYGYTNDNGLDDSSASSDSTTASPGTGGLDPGTLFQDSTSVACAQGTKDLGIQNGYHDSQLVKIRVCAVPTIPSTSEESHNGFGVIGANGGVVVNSRISANVLAMAAAAKADGVSLAANSGFRTMAHQTSLCPCDAVRVAIPGTSNHQMGLAIDFGGGLPSTPGPIPNNAFWNWLSANAGRFGLKNYPQEAWHWSATGN